MIQIGDKFVYEETDEWHIVEKVKVGLEFDANTFQRMFENYLQVHYGITEEQFKSIIKNAGAEEFI